MNIKSSLTIKFTAIVAGILIIFSICTYEFSAIFRKIEFNERLRTVSTNVVKNFLEKKELTPNIFKLIFDKKLNRFSQERLIISNSKQEIIFSSKPAKPLEIELISRLNTDSSGFEQNDEETEYCAYTYPFENSNYYVIASAIDKPGRKKHEFLRILLFSLILISIIIAAISGWYFSKQALQPIKNVISQVDTINESNLHQRVKEGKGKDEITQLAIVFNKMLERIEKSFSFQKMFVANASHEFRTPLTSMKGQIDVLLLQKRTEKEYLNTFGSLQEDIQNLISLITGLTELASANADFPNITFKNVSIIEVIMDSKEDLLKRKQNYKIMLEWGEFPEEEKLLQTKGDLSLLKSVFINLMDNACKFSKDFVCEVKVEFSESGINIEIKDKGAGIKSNEIPHIFDAFYRSNETRQVPGYGIGLSLVKKTIDLHKGKLSIESKVGIGTTVSVFLLNRNSN